MQFVNCDFDVLFCTCDFYWERKPPLWIFLSFLPSF